MTNVCPNCGKLGLTDDRRPIKYHLYMCQNGDCDVVTYRSEVAR